MMAPLNTRGEPGKVLISYFLVTLSTSGRAAVGQLRQAQTWLPFNSNRLVCLISDRLSSSLLTPSRNQDKTRRSIFVYGYASVTNLLMQGSADVFSAGTFGFCVCAATPVGVAAGGINVPAGKPDIKISALLQLA